MIRSTDDEPMTLAERYSRAVDSSNLRMKEGPGDLDVIVSAGMLEDALGASLLRLRVEYDSVSSEHRAAEIAFRARDAESKRQRGDRDGLTAETRSALIMARAQRAAMTAHMLIMVRLTTLREAKEIVAAWAIRQAPRLRFHRPPEHIMALACRVLDVHVSPICRHCQGRGLNGNLQKGERQAPCRPCKGSGNRRESIGRDDADRGFASALLMELNSIEDAASKGMGRGSRAVRRAKELIRAAEVSAR